jgi:hypothetical protein
LDFCRLFLLPNGQIKRWRPEDAFSEAGTFGLGLYPIVSLSNRKCFLCYGFIYHNFWLKKDLTRPKMVAWNHLFPCILNVILMREQDLFNWENLHPNE